MISRLSLVAAALLAAATVPTLAAPATFEPVGVSSRETMQTGRAGDAGMIDAARGGAQTEAAGVDLASRWERGERRERYDRDRRYRPRYDREERLHRRDRRDDGRDRRHQRRERDERG